jgi:hypothetical protein
MTVDAGANGQNGNGGHGHNDTLSFDLWAHGRPLVVDPGTYVYTADYAARNRFRSTAFHNTVQVDGAEMNRIDPDRLFVLSADATPTVRRWQTDAGFDILEAEHDGYCRLPRPVTHRRAIVLDKAAGVWMIRDVMTGEGTHRLDLWFHLPPVTVTAALDDPMVVHAAWEDAGRGITLAVTGPAGMTVSVLAAELSPSYGVRQDAVAVRYTSERALPVEFVTVLVPWSGTPPASATACHALGASAAGVLGTGGTASAPGEHA